MKKTTVFMMIIFIIANLTGTAQENNSGKVIRKQKFCSAKITMLDKSVEKYALGGFAVDTIIVFPIQMIDKHPQIQVERETRIAATSIKKIAIRIEKIRNAPGIYSNDSAHNKGANDAIGSAFKKNKTNETVGVIGDVLLETGGDPLGFALGVFMLPILIPISILSSQEKVYRINGKPEKLYRMEKKLTSRKHVTKK